MLPSPCVKIDKPIVPWPAVRAENPPKTTQLASNPRLIAFLTAFACVKVRKHAYMVPARPSQDGCTTLDPFYLGSRLSCVPSKLRRNVRLDLVSKGE